MPGVIEVFEQKGLRRVGDFKEYERLVREGEHYLKSRARLAHRAPHEPQAYGCLVDATDRGATGTFLLYPHRGHRKLHLKPSLDYIERHLDEKPELRPNEMEIWEHWHYAVDGQEWSRLTKIEGDEREVLAAIAAGTEIGKPSYTFRLHQLTEGSFWTFVPETEGWEDFEEIIIPRFAGDMAGYKAAQRRLGHDRETRPIPVQAVAQEQNPEGSGQ